MPYIKRITLLLLVLSVALASAFSTLFAMPLIWAWLASVNLVAFCTYGYDKFAASSQILRIPEWTLLALALLGGSPAALAAMQFFRHKTSKREFQIKFWLIAGVQALVYFAWRSGILG